MGTVSSAGSESISLPLAGPGPLVHQAGPLRVLERSRRASRAGSYTERPSGARVRLRHWPGDERVCASGRPGQWTFIGRSRVRRRCPVSDDVRALPPHCWLCELVI